MRKNWKKKVVLVMSIILAMLAAGCGKKSQLPEGFREEEVKAQAEKDIETAQSGNYEDWLKRFPEEFQAQLPKEAFDAYLEILKEKGAFQEFGKTAFVGQEENGKKYAGVIYLVQYENGQLKYTVGYDEEMRLIQFLAQ